MRTVMYRQGAMATYLLAKDLKGGALGASQIG